MSAKVPVAPPNGGRSPLRRTKVEDCPRPRRLTLDPRPAFPLPRPVIAVPVPSLAPPAKFCGIDWAICCVVEKPLSRIALRLIVITGDPTGARPRMRVPVTRISVPTVSPSIAASRLMIKVLPISVA